MTVVEDVRADLLPAAPTGVEHRADILLPAAAVLVTVTSLFVRAEYGLDARFTVRAGLVIAWCGATLFAARSRLPWCRLLGIGAACGSVWLISTAATTTSNEDARALVASIALCLLPAIGAHLLVGLPDGRLSSSAQRGAIRLTYGAAAVLGIGVGLLHDDVEPWPIAVFALVVVAAAIATANGRYRRAANLDRQRMQWIGMALALTAEAAVVIAVLRLLTERPVHGIEIIEGISVTVPFAFAIASARRSAVAVDHVVPRFVATSVLAGLVCAAFAVVVVGLGRRPQGDERQLLLLSMVAAAGATALYVPTRKRLSEATNRFIYGEKNAPEEVLSSFGARLSRSIPMEELLLQLAESLRKSLHLAAAEVWTGADGVYDIAASVPDRRSPRLTLTPTEIPVVARAGVTGPAWLKVWVPALVEGRADRRVRVAPITHSGKLLGLLVAERAADAAAFTDDEERVVSELARQVGLALHNVQLDSALQASLDEVRRQADELRASRARIVVAADQARRKIERNLHDGAQQHLVALSVKIGLARQLIDADPEMAAGLLDELRTDTQETLKELRELAHGIYPPLLADRGLSEALRAAANRAVLPTTVDAADIDRFAADEEAAVYFCVLEALQNAGKHAGPEAEATVRVWVDEGVLQFEVADTGSGFDPTEVAVTGHGFVNMADRLGAIGGTLVVDAGAGRGTRIGGRIPLGRA